MQIGPNEYKQYVRLAKKIKLIYIAGPYSGRGSKEGKDASRKVIHENIMKARRAAMEIWAKPGLAAFCPHLNSYHFERSRRIPHAHDKFLPADFKLLAACDAIFLLPGWEESYGTNCEIQYAADIGIPVFYSLNSLFEHFGVNGGNNGKEKE